MADLKPWQRKIAKPEDAKANERVGFYPGVGLIASDMENKEYIKYRDAKLAKRQKKKEALVAKRKERVQKMRDSYNRVITKLRERVTSLIESKKALREKYAGPHVSIEQRVEKAKARMKKEQDRLKKLEALAAAKAPQPAAKKQKTEKAAKTE
jgi:hypothetical protein